MKIGRIGSDFAAVPRPASAFEVLNGYRALALAVLASAGLLLLAGCDDPATAKRAVENMGLSNVETLGWAPGGCSRDDTFCTKFAATNAQGKRVTGMVGSSPFFKGATVRFD